MNFRGIEEENFLTAAKEVSESQKTEKYLWIIQQKLEKAKRQVENSNRLKSVFLSNMSHEVRTPMNGILGFAELLKAPDLTPEDKEIYINTIIQSTNRLLSVIDDILLFSSLETEQIQVQYSQINLSAIFEKLHFSLSPLAQETGNDLSFSIAGCLSDRCIQSDEEKLKQVLYALIHNALRFNDQGKVKVWAEKEENGIRFTVKDNGMGIAHEDLERIFLPFEKVTTQEYRVQNGLGLGLAISKRLVEKLGGRLGVHSTPGEGSLFYFWLPLKIKGL